MTAEPPFTEPCAEDADGEITGLSITALAKEFRFVTEEEFATHTSDAIESLPDDAGLLGIGCGVPNAAAQADAYSCVNEVALAFEGSNPQAALILLYRADDAGTWKLIGLADWVAEGPIVAGGETSIQVAGRETPRLWFIPVA